MASRNILAPCEIKRCVATKKNSGSRLFSGKVFLKTGATMLAIMVLLVAVTALILGLRFSGFVLGLLILLVTTSILVIAIWNGGKPGVVALQLLAMLASVQISYLIGCLIGAQITARAKPTKSGQSICTSKPPQRRMAEASLFTDNPIPCFRLGIYPVHSRGVVIKDIDGLKSGRQAIRPQPAIDHCHSV
jgi:hypothetical protein